MNNITRVSLMFEAELDIVPFKHEHVTIRRLHVAASVSEQPGFWWAEGIGIDENGHPVSVYALTADDLPASVLQVVEDAYNDTRAHIPERIIA